MSTEQSRALVRGYFEAYNQGDLAALQELLSPDFVCWTGGAAEPIRGLELNLQMEAYHRSAFSDIRVSVLDLVADGDRVAVRRSWHFKHSGPFEGVAPTGKEIDGTAQEIFRIEAGQIAEIWTESDNLSFMQQLGAGPTANREPGL